MLTTFGIQESDSIQNKVVLYSHMFCVTLTTSNFVPFFLFLEQKKKHKASKFIIFSFLNQNTRESSVNEE
jgi:hypothetical protein